MVQPFLDPDALAAMTDVDRAAALRERTVWDRSELTEAELEEVRRFAALPLPAELSGSQRDWVQGRTSSKSG